MGNKKILLEQFKLYAKQISYDISFSKNGKDDISNMFRMKTVNNIIKVIENINKENLTIDDFLSIKGIGKKSLVRIEEVLKTGKLKEVKISSLDEQYLKYIEDLEEVYGIGKKMAYTLFKKHGIKTVEELKKQLKNGDIVLPDTIVKGVKYIGKIEDKIKREEIDDVSIYLDKILKSIDKKLYGIVCGSYRRNLPVSGDIDFIIVHTDIKTKNDGNKSKINYLELFINKLINKKFIEDSLTGTNVETKYMGLYKWKTNRKVRRIDIRFIPTESYFSALLYFTGPKDFNRKMRSIAISNNYTLNEYGLFDNKTKKMFRVGSEKQIFDLLDMEYVEPEKRK